MPKQAWGGRTDRAPARAFLFTGILLLFFSLHGCQGQSSPPAQPEEFPTVSLGMTQEEVLQAVAAESGQITEESEDVLTVVERDRRVAEESFLFYHGRLAAWTLRFAEDASRGGYQRLARRFTLAYGEPVEESDDGWVLRSRWRVPEGGGRLLLSGYVGGRGADAPLMARLEDPSVMPRLIRHLREKELKGEDSDSLRSRQEEARE